MLKRTQSFLYSINATAIFCLIGLMPLIGDRVIDSLAILLVLNLTLSREIIRNLKRNLVVCTLLIQYPIINLINVSLRETNEFSYMHAPANFEMWAWSCVAIILSGVFFSSKISEKFIRYGIPLSVLITFGVIAKMWFPFGGRIEPFGHPVFYAPLFGTSLALLYIFRSGDALRRPGVLEITVVALLIIIAVMFSGTRGVFIAQVVVLFVATLITIVKQHWRWAITMSGSGLVSIVLVIVTLSWTDDGTLNRLKSTITAAQTLVSKGERSLMPDLQLPKATMAANTAGSLDETEEVSGASATATNLSNVSAHLKNVSEKIESSGGLRLKFWAMSINKIIEQPLIGYGANHEPEFLNELGVSFTHVHNIYLSWMLWGGVITVLSGLIFIFAAPLGTIIAGAPLPHKVSTLSLSVLWSAAMALDSFIVYEAFNYIFIILSTLAFASHSRE